MAKFLVQKSAPLKGEVTISGAKNAVLPILAATLLTEDKCIIKETLKIHKTIRKYYVHNDSQCACRLA